MQIGHALWANFPDLCRRPRRLIPIIVKDAGGLDQSVRAITPSRVDQEGDVPYAFYNAGVQIFDVEDAGNPKIAAYYVPRFAPEAIPDFAQGNATYGIFVEYDRNIIWAFTSHGIYALSSSVLGEPMLSVPDKPWPPRGGQ